MVSLFPARDSVLVHPSEQAQKTGNPPGIVPDPRWIARYSTHYKRNNLRLYQAHSLRQWGCLLAAPAHPQRRLTPGLASFPDSNDSFSNTLQGLHYIFTLYITLITDLESIRNYSKRSTLLCLSIAVYPGFPFRKKVCTHLDPLLLPTS